MVILSESGILLQKQEEMDMIGKVSLICVMDIKMFIVHAVSFGNLLMV